MKNQKVGFIPKLIIFIAMLIIFALGGLYFYEASQGQLSFFTEHFSMGIILFIVGCIALSLPIISQKSLAGDDKGDRMMVFVGIALMVCAAIAVLTSFM